MSPTNHGAILASAHAHPFTVGPTPYSKPAANEVVIRNRALAINPADIVIQSKGVLVNQYPAILGCDVAGEIVQVGDISSAASSSLSIKVGDRVTGAATPLETRDSDSGTVYHTAGFQEYVVLRLPLLAKIPSHTRFEDAAVLPLGIMTAASCLFPAGMLGLHLPPLDANAAKPGQGKFLLVWAASSSVGCCGVQLATAAGYRVVGVASARNHAMVRSAGAVACFDQNDADVVDQVVEYLATATASSSATTTEQQEEQQEKEKESIIVGAYDGISTQATIPSVCEILHRCGARKFVASVYMGAEQFATHDVEVKLNFSYVIDKDPVAVDVWAWVAAALEDGRLKCLPPADVVGTGLGEVQHAVDVLAKGVSAKKVVVSL